MRRLVTFIAVVIGFSSFGQDRGEFWFATGVKREIAKNIVAGANTNLRVSYTGQLQTLYQEVSVKSEHLSWFRPSIEYRLITSYDERGNYLNSNRININMDFRHKIDDIRLGTRLRYQMNLGAVGGGGGDLDPSYRFKPYFSYEPKGWKVTPEVSTEWFYSTTNSPNGNRFNRFRGGVTANINLPGSNSLGITYYYGRKFNTGNPYSEHILSLEYEFEWK